MDPLKEVKETMGSLVQFILDNMEQKATIEIQTEFNILYDQYEQAMEKAKYGGLTGETMLMINPQSPVQVPEEKMDLFEEWLDERMYFMIKGARIIKELN